MPPNLGMCLAAADRRRERALKELEKATLSPEEHERRRRRIRRNYMIEVVLLLAVIPLSFLIAYILVG
ncbi:hypothetical protein HYZ80_02535 [Candidatus Parcubacteria bacterium]|nr:hypothetical protein [Candidatus Parcubacteria bacterium]